MVIGIVMAIDGAVVSGGGGTVNTNPLLHGPGPVAFAVRIHHTASPGGSVTPDSRCRPRCLRRSPRQLRYRWF